MTASNIQLAPVLVNIQQVCAPRQRLAPHTCHTTDKAVSINTDYNHPLRTTDPACSGCVLRSEE